MLRFLGGFALVSALLFVIAVLPRPHVFFRAIEISLQPAAAMLAFAAVHWIRPRRLLVGPSRASAFLIALGAAAGLIAVALAAVALAFLDRQQFDGPVMVVSGALAGLVAAIFLRRHRPGWCIFCRYDLRGREPASACPECGHEQHAGHVRREPTR